MKIGPHVFRTGHTSFTPDPMLYNVFNRPDTPKSAPSSGAPTFTCNTCSLDLPDSAF